MKDYVPSDEEFEVIIHALSHYCFQIGKMVANEETLRATLRLTEREIARSENDVAFDAFAPKDESQDGITAFTDSLIKEIDQKAILSRCKEEGEKITVLQAKIIRLRDEVRGLNTDEAIRDLLT